MTSPDVSEHLNLAIAVLKKASLFDPTFSKPDHGMALAWAEALSKYGFGVQDCLDAVSMHYENHRERIAVADVIRNARSIRRERAEREKAAEIRALAAAPPASERTRAEILQWCRGTFGIDRDVDAIARLDPPPQDLDDAHRRLSFEGGWDRNRVALAMHKWNAQKPCNSQAAA